MKLFCVLVSLILVNVKADSESDYKYQVQITNHLLEELPNSRYCERYVDDLVEEVIHSCSILFSKVDSTVEEESNSYSSFLPLALMLTELEQPVYDKGGKFPKFEELVENEKIFQKIIRRNLEKNILYKPSNIDLNEKSWGYLGWRRRRITCSSLKRLTDGIDECEQMHRRHKELYRRDPRFMKGRAFNEQEKAFLKWQKEYKPTATEEDMIDKKNVKADCESDYKYQVQLTNHLFQDLLDRNGIVDDIVEEIIHLCSTSFIQLALMLIAPENPAYDKDGKYPKSEDLVDNEKLFQNVIRRKLGKNTNDKPSKIELNEEDWGSLGRRRRLITLSSIQRLIDDGQTKRRVFNEEATEFLKWQSLYFPISKRDVKVDENDNSPVIET